MALVGCDGFDSYGATADLIKKWFSAPAPWAWSATAGKFGGGCLQSAGATGGVAIYHPLGILTAGDNYRAFWFKFSAAPATATVFCCEFSSGLVPCRGITLGTDGTLSCEGSPSGPRVVADNNWHWLEAFETNSGYGQTIIYIDGGLYVSGSNSFGSTAPATWGFRSIAGITMTFDDEICYDNSAGTPNTASFPIGPRQITTLRPSSDGACTFGTLSSGTTHFNLLNETNPDGDTSYVQDATSGSQDLLNFPALGYSPLNITGVVVNIYANAPSGSINNQLVCKSGATTATSPSIVTPVSYITRQGAFSQDPATSAAWTIAGLNAAQFGFKNP